MKNIDDAQFLAEEGFTSDEIEAAQVYRARRDRKAWPDGKLDGPRFVLTAEERQWCCVNIRPPSYAWPHSMLKHACTASHYAALFGVDVKRLRKAARRIDEKLERK